MAKKSKKKEKNKKRRKNALTALEAADYSFALDTPKEAEKTPIKRKSAVQKVNVDFNLRMLEELDAEASYMGINRQAVIKSLCEEALLRRRRERQRLINQENTAALAS